MILVVNIKCNTYMYTCTYNVPKAKHVVITAGKPSGMAATARATAILK